jgi:hypothetical protein
LRKTVSITALSAVGAAFSAGAGAGAVCAATAELYANAPANTAIVVHDLIVRGIAVSLAWIHRRVISGPRSSRARLELYISIGETPAHGLRSQRRFFKSTCEARHTQASSPALLHRRGWAAQSARIAAMSTRRKAYWWFWFVASGRFLEKFLGLRGC